MDFESVEARLNALISYEKNLGRVNYDQDNFNLLKLKTVLKEAGVDYDSLKFIHVAGSKGKGTTCQMLSDYLLASGFTVGLFTSPHMFSVRERIVVNGEKISEDDFAKLLNVFVDSGLTYFEVLTAMALKLFVDKGLDYVVLEVGLGGRLDATNIIEKPELAILTTVEMEHKGILGDTIGEILNEKLGIVKDDHLLVTGWQNKEVNDLISQKFEGREGFYMIEDFEGIDLEHFDQARVKNAKVVYAALSLLLGGVYDDLFMKMFEEFSLLGRCDQRVIEGKKVIFDMAHTVNSVKNLLNGLGRLEIKKPIFLVGFLKDKDVDGMLALMKAYGGEVVFTECHLERGLKGENFWENPVEAFDFCFDKLKKEQVLIVTGSHFLVEKLLPRQ